MIAKVRLLHDRAASVAVGAPHLASGDLAFQDRDGDLSVCELDDAGSLGTDVVEIEDDGGPLAAVHASGVPKMIEKEKEVPAAERPGAYRGAPFLIHSPRPHTLARATAVAVRTYELTVGDFSFDSFQPVALSHELANFHSLGPDVIELQDRGIRRPAIRTPSVLKNLEDVCPRRGAPLVTRTPALPSVKIAAVRHIRPSALLASRLTPMEVRSQQDSSTPVADLRRLPVGQGRRATRRPHRLDVPGPHAGGGKRDAEFSADLAERTTLAA
jgi:hypothetical protein